MKTQSRLPKKKLKLLLPLLKKKTVRLRPLKILNLLSLKKLLKLLENKKKLKLRRFLLLLMKKNLPKMPERNPRKKQMLKKSLKILSLHKVRERTRTKRRERNE